MAMLLHLLPSQQYNTTLLSHITPTSLHPPFYHTTRSSILPFLGDRYLSLALPVVAYWTLSLVFHFLDTAKFPYFEKHRLHESPEVISRNKATVTQVIRAVLVQQFVQTALGMIWLEDEETLLRREHYRDHLGEMAGLAPGLANLVMIALGRTTGEEVLKRHGEGMVRWVYWWGIPIAQMLLAFACIDTWQYFAHRAFHSSRWLYRHFHSVHHRLYVPYAFGALYNHPLEGLLLDTIGALSAHELARLTTRQDIFLFTFATIKTVDDHCGYRLWWDPLQFLFPNNADYHDIHHQAYGIKSNFSQPFFTNWDKILGTEMTRNQASAKTRRVEKVE